MSKAKKEITEILDKYNQSFNEKKFEKVSRQSDELVDYFGIPLDRIEENKQYWNRELGKCWERVVSKVFEINCGEDFGPALQVDDDEPADFTYKGYAIDTKYRIGSGDSGTLKKFKQYGSLLREKGYTPVLLFLRSDNLEAAITACKNGGWEIYIADDSYEFIEKYTGFDLKDFLVKNKS